MKMMTEFDLVFNVHFIRLDPTVYLFPSVLHAITGAFFAFLLLSMAYLSSSSLTRVTTHLDKPPKLSGLR